MTQSIKLLSTIRRLPCGNLVYKVEKSKFEIEVAFLRLFNLLIASITGLLLCSIQKVLTPVKNACLKTKRKIYVVVLEDLGDLGDAIMKLPLIEFLHLRHSVHIRQSMIFYKILMYLCNNVYGYIYYILDI